MSARYRFPKLVGGHVALCHACGAYFAARRAAGRSARQPVRSCSARCRYALIWRARADDRIPPQTRVCAQCGRSFDVPIHALAQERVNGPSRRKPQRFCSETCHQAAIPPTKYTDERDEWREKKRRQRANRRARGIASDNKPYKSEACRIAASRMIVPPEKSIPRGVAS